MFLSGGWLHIRLHLCKCLPFHNFVSQSTVSRRTLRITATLLFRLSHCSFVQLITFDPILLHLLPSIRSWLPLVHSHQPWLCVSRKTREDVIFGRDLFNYCAAEPFASMDLIEPGMCLFWGIVPILYSSACVTGWDSCNSSSLLN